MSHDDLRKLVCAANATPRAQQARSTRDDGGLGPLSRHFGRKHRPGAYYGQARRAN